MSENTLTKTVVILAIDPGVHGGISIDYSCIPAFSTIEAHKMPDTPKDACDLLSVARDAAEMNGVAVKCYMEEVGGYVGGLGQPGSAMFNFGKSAGLIEGFLIALGIEFELVRPMKWQKAVGLVFPPKHKGLFDGFNDAQQQAERKRITNLNAKRKRDNKNSMKEMAQRLYPNIKVTLDTADSLLILRYGKLQIVQ